MAPGPRKKNSNRQGSDALPNSKVASYQKPPPPKVATPFNSYEPVMDSDTKRYHKRTVHSNWNKYDDPVNNPNADKMRGEDFEILLSYSVGSESQLQLQDEKEWEEATINEKSLVLDIGDLVSVVKCIPFHQRMNVPEEIFNEDQITQFATNAEKCRKAYYSKQDIPTVAAKTLAEPEKMDSSLNIIQSYESEETDIAVTKSVVLEEKSENIIESLASCLSLKTPIGKNSSPDTSSDKKSSDIPDDLDFLLSLSTSKSSRDEKLSTAKKTNVDDWLNSILD